jgi:hypothetical protein
MSKSLSGSYARGTRIPFLSTDVTFGLQAVATPCGGGKSKAALTAALAMALAKTERFIPGPTNHDRGVDLGVDGEAFQVWQIFEEAQKRIRSVPGTSALGGAIYARPKESLASSNDLWTRRFGDIRSVVTRLTDLERGLQDAASIDAFLPGSSTDVYRLDRRAVTSASWWRKEVRTHRQALRRVQIFFRRKIDALSTGFRWPWLDADDDSAGIDHSTESHRSRAPGRNRKTLPVMAFREFALT